MVQKPLAEILRPKNLNQYVGQQHLIGEGEVLRKAIDNNNLPSMILWGPPGVGKTTLALVMAELTDADFFILSAINSGVKEIREAIENAKKSSKSAILFIDEIHRFSKSQQDSLLGAVEQGIITLIGATTENPSFEVIAPLLSRCQVYVLKSLTHEELKRIIHSTIQYIEQEQHITIEIKEDDSLMRISGGDARKLINALELTIRYTQPIDGKIIITNELVTKCIQKNLAIYDKQGENHYDIISAFIKSIRGSDPNAAVYWLARMLIAGEDPLFIARRLIILASEDIGNANPNALLLANNCFQSVHQIGMPEARIILSQTAIYLASSPKSNASCVAIDDAYDWIKKTGDLSVPLHLRNAPTSLMKELDYGKNYQYAHNFEHNFVNQEFLPISISGKKFYEPQNNARENELRRYLKNCWNDKYKYVIIFIIGIFACLSIQGQDIHYSQFYNAPLQLNPATVGAFDGIIRAGVNQKTQWLSVTKPFVTISGNFDMPLYKNNKYRFLLGIGACINNDQAGDSKFHIFDANLCLSAVKNIGEKNKHKLAIGIIGGYNQSSIDYSELNFDEQYQNGYYDPNRPISEVFTYSRTRSFNIGLGMAWSYFPNRKTLFSLGCFINHLNHSSNSFQDGHYLQPLKIAPYFTSKIALTNEASLCPMIYTSLQDRFREFVFGSNFEYSINKNRYTTYVILGAGLLYRWNDAFIITALIDWKNLRFGFSYDINISSFISATSVRGGFEFSLYYTYKKSSIRKIGKEPCPFEIM